MSPEIETGGYEPINTEIQEQDAFEEAAINVVNMFDQVNTNDTVENIGSRGMLLKGAIDDLRAIINEKEQKTILSQDQVR